MHVDMGTRAAFRRVIVVLAGMALSVSAQVALADGLAAANHRPKATGPKGCAIDSWTPTSLVDAPSSRLAHTAVWTGKEMIIWGGRDLETVLDTGGRYDPAADTWTATSLVDAPMARFGHTAVWTGTEMIIWGGDGAGSSGARYDPSTDTWTATSQINAPLGRRFHSAVWTGKEMIVFGGSGLDAGRYDPSIDTWTTAQVPGYQTHDHSAVWTGTEMIVWGGALGSTQSPVNTGRRYDPVDDRWSWTSQVNAPSSRFSHTGVWTGSEMIVWGGYAGGIERRDLDTGGRYDPLTDSWVDTSLIHNPGPRDLHTAVWTGSEMIVWGGQGAANTGGRYDPATDTWSPTNREGAAGARMQHTAVWTGAEMIVWGGDYVGNPINTGGRYCAAGAGPARKH